MFNIFYLLFFFFISINIGISLNKFFKLKIDILNPNNLFNFLVFGFILNFFIIWIVGIYYLNTIIFFFIFIFLFLFLIFFNNRELLDIYSNYKFFIKKNNFYLVKKNKFIFSIILIILITFLIIGFSPPIDIDSLNYHLTLPKKDIEYGKIIVNGWNESEYMPMFLENFLRLFLLFGNETIGHQFNFFLLIFNSLLIYLICKKLKFEKKVAILAVLFFLLIKGNMWLVTTTHNELLLTFFLLITFSNYLSFAKSRNKENLFFMSLGITGMLYTKYHGIIFSLIITLLTIFNFFYKKLKINIYQFLIIILPGILFLPIMIRNYYLVGDPFFPLFKFYDALGGSKAYGYSTNLLSLFFSPIEFTLFPNKYFDGNYLGVPYLIFLLYSSILIIGSVNLKKFGSLLIISLFYYVFWFYGLSQQVRYLIPVFALLSILCSFTFFKIIKNFETKRIKIIFIIIFIIFLFNQLIFLSIYALQKGPVALGFVNKKDYLTNYPDTDYAFYGSCSFLNKNIKNNNYVAVSIYLPYYCPQKKSLRVENDFFFKKNNLSKNDIKSYIVSKNIKYIFIQEKDRKITKTGFDIQKVYINNPNIEIIMKQLKIKMVYKDFQSTIYLIEK
jgi:hypothetical protein